MKILFSLLILFLCGCHSRHISVQTQYLSRSDLASFYIETPDPQLYCPLYGQRLLIQWHFPGNFHKNQTLSLNITIRFGDRSEITQKVMVDERYGYYIYSITGDQYHKLDGIRTYKVNLLADDKIIETWYHQLWVELITLKVEENEAVNFDEDDEAEKTTQKAASTVESKEEETK